MSGPGWKLDHVLVVDDDPLQCAIVESYFKRRGARQITTAANGLEALAIIDQAQSQLCFVLCDLNMPELDGVKFLRHLQQRGFGAPIAILSGEDESVIALAECIARTHRLNIVGALRKPANVMDLDRLVSDADPCAETDHSRHENQADSRALQAAILEGRITAHYQPQLDVRTGKLAGVEVLARWAHPQLGVIEPDHFIPLAEDSGLIRHLTDVVIGGALSDDIPWQKLRSGPKIAFNVSLAVLENIDFPDELAARADAAGLERSRIVCEIGQSKLLAQKAAPMEVMARLRLLGFELSIDDFGTAYSGIDALKMFPFSELKLDLAIVSQAPSEEHAQAIIRSCTSLAGRFGLRVVAERVETRGHLELVASRGVHVVQGNLLAKPMPADALTGWILNHGHRAARRRHSFAQDQAPVHGHAVGTAQSIRNPAR